jgi:hypothetical protein
VQPVTLTETIVDFADYHSTLYYLGPPRPDPRLPLGNAADYKKFYEAIAATPLAYSAIKGTPGAILNQLKAAYTRNKYWRRYLTSGDYDHYHAQVWDKILPVKATLTARIEITAATGPAGVKLRVSPCVLLYPLGWSTWVSVRVTGDHTIPHLVDLFDSLLAKPVFTMDGGSPIRLQEVFDGCAAAIREDAFGGKETADLTTPVTLTVTTVLGKHGGSPDLKGLDLADKKLLRRLVRRSGPSSPKTDFDKIAYELPSKFDDGVAYMLHEGCCRFLWVEDLLAPQGRNRQLLRCYHNNTSRSLIQAWHLYVLLTRFVKEKGPSDPLRELAEAAVALLEPLASDERDPFAYKNASLAALFDDFNIGKILQKAAGVLK